MEWWKQKKSSYFFILTSLTSIRDKTMRLRIRHETKEIQLSNIFTSFESQNIHYIKNLGGFGYGIFIFSSALK